MVEQRIGLDGELHAQGALDFASHVAFLVVERERNIGVHAQHHVLVAVDDKPVTDSATMLNLIAALKPGSQATLRVMREAKPMDLRVTVGKRPPKQQARPE